MSFGLFNTKSTYQSDFVAHRIHSSKPVAKLKFDDPALNKEPVQMKQMDVSTMKNFQPNTYVPFDLFFRPKDCITTNPFEDTKYTRKDESNKFAERLQARKTRPRVYMIPQISLDDVDQNLMYKSNGLSDNIYTSDWKIATEFTKEYGNKTVSDVPPNYKPKDVSFKPKEYCTKVEPGLQKYGQEWNRYQIRANGDPTEMFWSRNDQLATCSVCAPKAEELLSASESAEINECLANESLRLPYQLKMPGYCGYMPQVATNIKPKRKLFGRMEPWLSSTMVAQGVYKKAEE